MLRSSIFDDIYFSGEDGLAETRHVFLGHNHLPAAWAGADHFTIAETGFGTGLNFLSAWRLFEETAEPGAVLDFVSFELYPLSTDQIAEALVQWGPAFGGRLVRMVKSYPLRIPGWHRIDFGRVRLTLIFDDVSEAIARLNIPRGVDAWFLDGFAPAKNPQMWTPVLFENMARLSHEGTTLASFTSAGLVKKGLREVGFTIEKCRGYGRKRDMIAGRFDRPTQVTARKKPGKIAIIGAGLAGTACAKVLRDRGIAHTVFEASNAIASGASGNERGIFNPRLSAQRGPDSDFYAAAFALTARSLREGGGADFADCGSLHLITDADKRKRFQSCAANWAWPQEHMRLVCTSEASALAGVEVHHDALYLPDSGQVSPRGLCARWADGSEVKLNTAMNDLTLDGYDAVILACGAAVKNFIPWLPVGTVRGQIVEMAASEKTSNLKANLCFGGYLGATLDGCHMVGSTFQKWLETTDLRDEDNVEILAQLETAVPGLRLSHINGARAALRCASQDRFPVIGAVPDHPGLYVSTGHGSHGIISALAGAHILADMLEGSVFSLPQDSVNILSPQRFLDRAARRGNRCQSN